MVETADLSLVEVVAAVALHNLVETVAQVVETEPVAETELHLQNLILLQLTLAVAAVEVGADPTLLAVLAAEDLEMAETEAAETEAQTPVAVVAAEDLEVVLAAEAAVLV